MASNLIAIALQERPEHKHERPPIIKNMKRREPFSLPAEPRLTMIDTCTASPLDGLRDHIFRKRNLLQMAGACIEQLRMEWMQQHSTVIKNILHPLLKDPVLHFGKSPDVNDLIVQQFVWDAL